MDKKNFHEDEDTRIESERCAAIVIKNNKILMMHRIKNCFEYYVFPGGHRRKDEEPSDTVIREVLEETNIEIDNPKLAFEFIDHESLSHDRYFRCNWKSGEKPELVGEEAVRNCEENHYEPEWISLENFSQLNVLPLFAKEWIMENILKSRSR